MSEPIFHLRRIGPKATKPDVADRMDFHKVTSIIGRNVDRVDFLLDSSNHVQRLCLSRCHARIVRQSPGNQHRLHDDSLNGVFVNNLKIAGSCVLREGDRVTFGHPSGQKLSPGSRARQPDSEYQFLFEKCNCASEEEAKLDVENSTKTEKQCDTDFKVPFNNTPPTLQKKRGRIPTQTFTQDDVKQMKQSWHEMSEAKSTDPDVKRIDLETSSNDPCSEMPDSGMGTVEVTDHSETDLKTSAVVNGDTSENDKEMDTSEAKVESSFSGDNNDKETGVTSEEVNSVVVKTETKIGSLVSNDANGRVTDAKSEENAMMKSTADKSETNVESSVSADVTELKTATTSEDVAKMTLADGMSKTEAESSVSADVNDKECGSMHEDNMEFEKDTSEAKVEANVNSEVKNIEPVPRSVPEHVEAKDSCDNLEETCEALMHDLAAIRSMVESPEVYVAESTNACTCIKSPTKDASIQTSQVPGFTVALTVSTLSPERVDTVKAAVVTSEDDPCTQLSIEHTTEDTGMAETNDAERADTDEDTMEPTNPATSTLPSSEHTNKEATIAEADAVVTNDTDTTVVTTDSATSDQLSSKNDTTEDTGMVQTTKMAGGESDETMDTVNNANVVTADSATNDELSFEPTTEDTRTDSAERKDTVQGKVPEDEVLDDKLSVEQVTEDANVTEDVIMSETDSEERLDTGSVSNDEPVAQQNTKETTENTYIAETNSTGKMYTVTPTEFIDDHISVGKSDTTEASTKPHDETSIKSGVEDLHDTDNDSRNFECELVPKESMDVEVEVLNEDLSNPDDNSKQDKKSAYMVSDSIEYDFEEDLSEEEIRDDEDASEPVSSEEMENDVSDTDTTDYLNKVEEEQDHVNWSDEELAKVKNEEINKCNDDKEEKKPNVETLCKNIKDESSNEGEVGVISIDLDTMEQEEDRNGEAIDTSQHSHNKSEQQLENLQDTKDENDEFECELLPKGTKSHKIEEANEDLNKVKDTGEHGDNSAYMLSDSIDYDFDDDFDENFEDAKLESTEKEDTDNESVAVRTADKEYVNEEYKMQPQENKDIEVMEVECVGEKMENEVAIKSFEQDIVIKQSDAEIGTEDTLQNVEEHYVPIVHKTPTKFNTSVVLSSQLSSPLLESGIENFTNDVQSPIIARQEACYTEGAKAVTDDEAEDADESVHADDDNEDNEDEEEVNDSDEQLSCNFSDYDDDGYSPPSLAFSDMEDSCEDEDKDTDNEGEEDMEDELGRDIDCEPHEVKIPKDIRDKANDALAAISHGCDLENVTVLSHEEVITEETSDETSNDNLITEEIDETNQYHQTKPPVKRKCDFDDIDSPKKYKSSDEESTPTFIFKTPNSKLSRNQVSTPKPMDTDELHADTPDKDEITGTQMMNSDHSLDMSSMTATQMDAVEESLEKKTIDNGTRSKPSRSKAADLLARLRAKKQQRQGQVTVKTEVEEDPVPGTSRETEADQEVGVDDQRDRKTAAEVTLEQVDSHVNRCREVLSQLKRSFDGQVQLRSNPRVVAWKQELLQIEKKLEFPKTVIAVVGDTGAGKSSLMNAILDHRSVLPTSGMRACTAVVVEVVENTNSTNFEADIEFLQKQEWLTELQVLLRDLTSFDGKVKKGQPDPASDAFVSWCKVKAVYGRIDTYETLSRINTVTHWLGKTKVIKSPKPEQFRRQVERYIETQDPGAGGQYWPIVKHVRLRMPRCDVCSSGAALVDLPGVRDSNAARDKIAREYLKNCTAVWVVSSIHRAIDDKTARDLLGETFRRQLLMDGQYGSIAFICTKTDVIIPSEIIRPLKLEDQISNLESKVSKLEDQKADLQLTVASCSRQLSDTRASVDTLRKEIVELEDNLTEIRTLLEAENTDSEQAEEHEALQEYQEEVKNKQEEIETHRGNIEKLVEQKRHAKQQIQELESELSVHRREITAICAKARNEYSKKEIRRDFKAGLKEMKRRAGMTNEDEDEEEEEDDTDDEDDDIGSTADNLKVFCCSSTEYQKLKNLLTDDGPAQVFSSLEDTEVPMLRRYVHEMTSVRRQQALERLVRGLGRFVFDLQSYTTTGSCSSTDRLGTKSVVDCQVQQLDVALVPVLKQLQADIDNVFDGSIRPKMEEGASNASSEANETVTKWGAPVNRDKTQDRRTGGLHFMTYRATVRRQGVYSSKTFGPVDMNEELAEPMYRSMTVVWDKTFSGMLWRVLDKVKAEMLGRLRACVEVVCQQLEQLGVPRDRSGRVGAQLQVSAANKLTEMVNHLKELITERQRTISRVVTPTVQQRMTGTYDLCAAESGQGMYMRMKTYMGNGVEREKCSMFDEATNKLMAALMELQTEILAYVQGVCQALMIDLRVAFEPLWDTPVNSSLLRSAFLKPVTEACTGVREIYRLAGLENTEEKTLAHTKGENSATPGGIGRVTSLATPRTSGVETLSTWTPQVIKQENQDLTKTTAPSGLRQIVIVKSEPGTSYTVTQVTGSGTATPNVVWAGTPAIQVKQEVKGATRSCTVGSGAYQYVVPAATIVPSIIPRYTSGPSSTNSAAPRPVVGILPHPSQSAAARHTFTHNAYATGSAPTVPPGVGSAATSGPSSTNSAAPRPVVGILPHPSQSAAARHTFTHNAYATGSAPTVPPGVGSAATSGPSSTNSSAPRPVVGILPHPSQSAAARHTFTHNAYAIGSAPTVPPGVGSAASQRFTHNAYATGSATAVPSVVGAAVRQITPAASPQYNFVTCSNGVLVKIGNATSGGVVTQTSDQSPAPNLMIQQPLTAAAQLKNHLLQKQASKTTSNSPQGFTTQGKENAFQRIQPCSSKKKGPPETITVTKIKKEPADSGYERKRPKYLGTIDLTDD